MKILPALFIITFFSCKSDVPVKHATNDVIKITSDTAKQGIMIYDINVNEFAAAMDTKDRFKPLTNKADTDTVAEIKTKVKKFTFKDIVPGNGNSLYDEDMVTYTNLGFNDKLNKHLVYVNYYEGGDYLLIDNFTAKTDTLIGHPAYSPNSKNFIAYYINPYSEREINGKFVSTGDIQIYITSNNELKQILSQSYDFIPIEIKWEDNNTILIKAIQSVHYDDFSNDPDTFNPDRFVYKKVYLQMNNQANGASGF